MSEKEIRNTDHEEHNDRSRVSKSGEGSVYAYATPSKKTYESISSDITVKSAIGELIDNALDSAALHGFDKAKISIDLQEEDGEEVLVVRDACGGVKKDDMGVFMGLGRSRDERADEQQVGTFGMGTKRALRRCGRSFTIKSRYLEAEQGWAYTVPAEWFEVGDDEESPSEWKFEMEPAELPDPWMTELQIYDLEFDWNDRREDLKSWIGTTYQKFLSDDSTVDLDLDISVDGQTIVPPEPVDWSFPPWAGGIHPRRFEGLVFADHGGEGEVQAQVTVGLLQEGDQERCGTYVFAQNRLVEGNLIDEKGGFGIGDGLNKFRLSQHKRLRIEIELFGDANDLPWSADKSRLRPTHPTLSTSPNKGVYWWLKRMADRHMRAAKYGAFGDFVKTDTVFKPYNADSSEAAHGGEIEVVNIGDKQRRLRRGEVDHIRISQKPSNDFASINRLAKVAYAHARLGIVTERVSDIKDASDGSTYASWAQPTYDAMVGRHFVETYYDESDRQFADDQGHRLLDVDNPESLVDEAVTDDDYGRIARHLTRVTDLPDIDGWTLDDDGSNYLDELFETVDEIAELSVEENSLRIDDPEWLAPYYQASVDRQAPDEVALSEFEETDTPILVEQPPEQDSDSAAPSGKIAGETDESEGDSSDGVIDEITEQETHSGGTESDVEAADTEPGETTDPEDSFRTFCRENIDLLDDVDQDLIDGDLTSLKEQVREQLRDGQTFRQIRRTDESTKETVAE